MAQGVRVSSPARLQVHAPPCGLHAPVPRPQLNARGVGVWGSPGDAERDEWRASPPEQAGSGEVGRGGEGGIRERRRRAAGGPRAAGSINSRPGLTGAAVTGGVASPAARGEGGARGAAGWGRRTPVSWWRRQEAEGEESRRGGCGGRGPAAASPRRAVSPPSPRQLGGLWGRARGGWGGAARGGAARFCLVLWCGAARALARGGPLGFPQDARPTAGGCGGSAGLWP